VLDLLLRVIGLLLVLLVCVNKDRTIVIVLVGAVAVVVRADWVRVVAASAALILLRRFFLAAAFLLRDGDSSSLLSLLSEPKMSGAVY